MLTFSDIDRLWSTEQDFTLDDIVTAFGLGLGLADYPIFDEAYRPVLNGRIFDHFQFRKPASDTPQMFVFYLNRRMRERMPTYNEIYKKLLDSELDPFATSDSKAFGTSTDVSDTTSNAKGTGSETSDAKTILSNTPASYLQNAEEPRYMSQLTHNIAGGSNSTTSDETSNATGTRDYVDRVVGRSGYLGDSVTSALVTGFMDTDRLVCEMLEPLFLQFWDDQPL